MAIKKKAKPPHGHPEIIDAVAQSVTDKLSKLGQCVNEGHDMDLVGVDTELRDCGRIDLRFKCRRCGYKTARILRSQETVWDPFDRFTAEGRAYRAANRLCVYQNRH